tara:strand:- start:772 stop:1611 length:840 start_codon:yes stop_codon:yes gene_type:complete
MKAASYILLKFISSVLTSFHIRNNDFISFSIFLENKIAFIRNKNVRFSYDSKRKLFKAEEHNISKFYPEKSRCFWLYRNGIEARGSFISKSYCLPNINFKEDDIIIDCGANSGDLFIELSNYIKPNNYIGIEPNPSDFEVLKLNCPKTTIVNKALGEKNSFLDFFIATSKGDSSIIRPKDYEKQIKIASIRLDELLTMMKIKKVKLLKLEAEGYEPEILLGAGDKINIFEYIAIDGGYERGEREEQTFTFLTNKLINNGFELLDINFPWYRALFKNKNL